MAFLWKMREREGGGEGLFAAIRAQAPSSHLHGWWVFSEVIQEPSLRLLNTLNNEVRGWKVYFP